MKKTIFLLLSISTLTACATFQPQPAFDWRGQNFDSYILKYGVPTSQYTLQNGNNVYSFKTNCPDTNAQEELLIIITPDNVIQEISRTSSCPTPPPEPIYYETGYIAPPPAHDKPMPKPKEQVAPKPKPAQDKPEPKPQAQAPAPEQKPTPNNLLQKPQGKESSDTKNTLSLMAKLGINKKDSNNSNKQAEENKTNNIKQTLSSAKNKSSKEVLGEKIKETKQHEQYKTSLLLGKNNTKK